MNTNDVRSLSEIIEGVRTHRKTLRVCNFGGSDAELTAVEEFFEPHDVHVVVEEAPDRPRDIAVLQSGTAELATSPMVELLAFVAAWEQSMAVGLKAEPPAVFGRLHDNFFESYDKGRMVMASRIPEFRAWNAGSGLLSAGFQDLSKLRHQQSAYRNLTQTDVSAHVYGVSDWELPQELADLHVHPSTHREVRKHWWVAYDGDGDDDEKVLLLAQEREPGRFYGFWTYDPNIVDEVLERSAWLARREKP